jgi:G3E family GTPase
VSVLNESELAQFMAIHKIVTVLDADVWEVREVFGRVFFSQLETADLILLNKIDCVEKEKVSQFLNEIHAVIPDSQIIPSIHCHIDPQSLWAEPQSKTIGSSPIPFFQSVLKDQNSKLSELHHSDHTHDSPDHPDFNGKPIEAMPYVTFSYRGSQRMDETRFKKFIGQLPWEVFRIKGPVRFTDRLAMLNFVGGKSDWSSWEGAPETRLAFIGWNVDGKSTIQKLKDCIEDE